MGVQVTDGGREEVYRWWGEVQNGFNQKLLMDLPVLKAGRKWI